jgi:hypothetical protein
MLVNYLSNAKELLLVCKNYSLLIFCFRGGDEDNPTGVCADGYKGILCSICETGKL